MRNDILKTTFCEKCNFRYDYHFDSCPKCKEKNPDIVEKRCRNKLFFLDVIKCFLIVALYFLTTTLLPTIVYFIVNAIDKTILDSNLFILGLEIGANCILIISVFLIIWHYKSYILKDFCNWRNILIGVIAGILIIGLSQLLSYLIYEVGNISINSNQVNVETIVKNEPVLAFFAVVILGPIAEELTFRVGLMGLGMKISEKYGKIFAYLLSIVIFIFIHLNLLGENVNYASEFAAVPSYFVGASLLCIAYDKGGLSSSIIAHILNNLLGFILVMVM